MGTRRVAGGNKKRSLGAKLGLSCFSDHGECLLFITACNRQVERRCPALMMVTPAAAHRLTGCR
jgi:hypothetical protein